MRILLKFAGTNEVIGSLTLERDTSVVNEPRELAFMGYSGQALYQPTERDEAVVLNIMGFHKVSWFDGDETVDTVNSEREELEQTRRDAAEAAQNTDGPVHPSALPLEAAENGERLDVNAPDRVPDASGDFRLVEERGENVSTDENIQPGENFQTENRIPETPEKTGNVPSSIGAEHGQEIAPRSGSTLVKEPEPPEETRADEPSRDEEVPLDVVQGTPPAGGKSVDDTKNESMAEKKAQKK